jgi:hypothetical protein
VDHGIRGLRLNPRQAHIYSVGISDVRLDAAFVIDQQWQRGVKSTALLIGGFVERSAELNYLPHYGE